MDGSPAAGDTSRLALLGGSPTFETALHVGRPNIGDRVRFAKRIEVMLDRRWLTNNGAYVRELESRMARVLEVRHCIVVCNGTAALQIMAKACGLRGEVIMPSFTFVATAHALEWQGITPVFCDIDPSTHNIDPARVEELVTGETSAILGVHVWGRSCDVSALERIARRHGLNLCFDAAHAFACSSEGRMIGGGGAAEAFSFHATKFFNTFEGGAITTDDDEVAERCRKMRDFGFTGVDRVESLGINGKMSEASAAMGLTNLEALATFIDANERNHHLYRKGLDGIPGLSVVRYPREERSNYQYVVIEVDADASELCRDELQAVLREENVLARRYFYPGCHRMAPYRDRALRAALPETERLTQRTLALPTGTAITDADVAAVCRIILQAMSTAPAVKAAVAATRTGGSAVRP